jgi:hypothetical protein
LSGEKVLVCFCSADGEGEIEMTGSMLLITELCDHFVPTEKATHTKKYVFLCILMFICIYIDIVLIGERVVMARCMAAVMHR